ncbi:hypothetical protein C5167_038613 [Papaver somniferum]|uniref:Uncharacterized protein n=1 Tax=Papaver somniferum TaxID=3469 RepID=A0A4Y7IA09_PAPSO|nr:hypothetical protein C5167_038613 [Papaver somniferum]
MVNDAVGADSSLFMILQRIHIKVLKKAVSSLVDVERRLVKKLVVRRPIDKYTVPNILLGLQQDYLHLMITAGSKIRWLGHIGIEQLQS